MSPHNLVIGDSIIRNVRTSSTITCFPDTAVSDKAFEILANEPDNTKVIVHVGTNDIRKEQNELLKTDFVHLFSTLKRSISPVCVWSHSLLWMWYWAVQRAIVAAHLAFISLCCP